MTSAPTLLNPREKNSLVVNIAYGRGLRILCCQIFSQNPEENWKKAVSVSTSRFLSVNLQKTRFFEFACAAWANKKTSFCLRVFVV